MAEFLTTNGTSHYIEEIIISADKKLTLISPFLQISKNLYERLKDATKRGVFINLIFGKDDLKPNEKNSLAGLKNLRLYYFENLHAKCYFNENLMVITSMNMYEYSEKNNREMGVLISAIDDKSLYDKAVQESISIINSSDMYSLSKSEIKSAGDGKKDKKDKAKSKRGFCLRCGERIPYNMDKPMCRDCYSEWAIYENYDYEEEFCHGCGEFKETTMEKPLCYKCYKKEIVY